MPNWFKPKAETRPAPAAEVASAELNPAQQELQVKIDALQQEIEGLEKARWAETSTKGGMNEDTTLMQRQELAQQILALKSEQAAKGRPADF